jgi:hypothetical protein
MSGKSRVPTSTTDWCISALTKALVQQQLAVRQHLGADVRTQVAGDGIDGLVFLFNADRNPAPTKTQRQILLLRQTGPQREGN